MLTVVGGNSFEGRSLDWAKSEDKARHTSVRQGLVMMGHKLLVVGEEWVKSGKGCW